MGKRIFNLILSVVLIASFVPNFASANLKEDFSHNSSDEYVSLDLSSTDTSTLEDFTEPVASDFESVAGVSPIIPEGGFNFASTDFEQSYNDAEIKACAYYVSKEIPGYEANTLYFYGYENPELENNDNVTKYEWANTNPKGTKSPFENASQNCTGILFDVSASNIRPVSCRCWFMNFGKCLKVDGFEYLNTGCVNDMSYMFNYFAYRATNPPNLDLSKWDTSNVTDMSAMFSRFAFKAQNPPILDVSNWDTSSVEDTSYMFSYFAKTAIMPATIYASDKFVVGEDTNSFDMFYNSNIQGGAGTTYDPEHIKADGACIDKGGTIWGENKGYFTAINTEDDNNPDCAYYVRSDKTLYFYGNPNPDLEGKTGVTKYNWANTGTNINKSPFADAIGCTKIVFDQSTKNTKPASCCSWFYDFVDCEQIVGIENLDTQNVKDMSCMFYDFASNVQKAPVLDLSKWNTYNVTDMHEMFFQFAYNVQEAPVLNVSKWNTSNVTDMSCMFRHFALNTEKPPILDVSKWNTYNVTDMSEMFSHFAYRAQNPPILDVSNWDTSNVINMAYMFCNFANNVQTPLVLNVSNWSTSKVKNMSNMFSDFAKKATKPATIYASDKFVVREDTISDGMFYNSNIQGGGGTTYDPEHINGAGACIDKLDGEWGSSKGYFTGGAAAIEFYANGADGTLPASAMHALSSEFVLPNIGEITPPNGFNFSGWAIGSVTGEIKQPNDVIIINKYTPVYAVWKNKVYSISFNENPPSKVDVVNNVAKPFNVTFGNGLNESVLVPECSGYVFEGYYYSYTNADGETSNVQIYNNEGSLIDKANIWDFNDLHEEIILNANWIKQETSHNSDCAYYVKEKIAGSYDANTLYFFGYENSDLEGKDGVTKYNWANTGTNINKSPFADAIGCTKIVFDESTKNTKPASCCSWFYDFVDCEQIVGIENLDTQNVKDMSCMFTYFAFNVQKAPVLDLSKWNTNNVTDMSYMFRDFARNTEKPPILDVSKWNTSNVTDMSGMFSHFAFKAQNPPILDVSNWDTSNVVNMSSMFYYFAFSSQTVPTLNVSNWDTSNVVNMPFMFSYFAANAQNPSILDVSNWDTSNVTDMAYMFCNFANNVQTPLVLNVSNWSTSKVKNMSKMFSDFAKKATKPATIYASDKFVVGEDTISDDMFYNSNIQGGTGTTYDPEHINADGACIDKGGTIWGENKGYFTAVNTEDDNNPDCAYYVRSDKTLYFYGNPNPDLEGKTGVTKYNWANTRYKSALEGFPFVDASRCIRIVFDESAKTIKPKSCCYWFCNFRDCEEIVGLENLDTSNVTNMHTMFYNFAYNVQNPPKLDVSKWNTSNVTDMAGMFYNFAYNVQNPPILDVSKWNTSNVTDMRGMFSHFAFKAQNPPILDVSNWDTSSVEDTSNMFFGFAKTAIMPATIYASEKFVVRQDTISDMMFYQANIQGGAGTTYDSEHINGAGACIDKLDGEWGLSKGYFTGGAAAIEFYANGADGTLPASAMHALNSEFVLPNIGEITPPNGFNFSGWAINGSSDDIKKPGESIVITKYTSLYAVWKNKVYSISFNANVPGENNLVKKIAKPFIVTFGNSLSGSVLVPECEGYIFEGYYYSYKNADGETSNVQIYNNEGSLIDKANIWDFNDLHEEIILNANWIKKDVYTISFNANVPGENNLVKKIAKPFIVTFGNNLSGSVLVPECEGYIFDGYYYSYTNADGETSNVQIYNNEGSLIDKANIWDFNDLHEEIILNANWIKQETSHYSDCAYYVKEKIAGGYDANTLYFFGYENSDLEGKSQVVKFNWANTGTDIDGSPFVDALDCKKIIFDESVIDIKPESCFCWFDGFFDCEQIVGIENLDTQNVKDMSFMFCYFARNAQNPPILNVSNWDTSNVINMAYMFTNFAKKATKPATIYASDKFVVGEDTSSDNMFYNSNIQGGAGTTYDPEHINGAGACIDKLDGEWGLSKGYFTGGAAAIEFYANGADGTLPVTVMHDLNSEFVLPDIGEITPPSGFNFSGWAINGSSDDIKKPGESIVITKYTSLYAVWENKVYTISFNANVPGENNLVKKIAKPFIITFGNSLSGSVLVPECEGYIFEGYYYSYTNADGETSNVQIYNNEGSLIDKANIWDFNDLHEEIILNANWIKQDVDRYTISFNANVPGENNLVKKIAKPFIVTFGNSLSGSVLVPECEGYIFEGYYYSYTNADGETSNVQIYNNEGSLIDKANIWDFNDLHEEIILNANWIKQETSHNSDCAYYVKEKIAGGYDANTLYFFGYENSDLEGKNQVVKFNWANTGTDIDGSPFVDALDCKKIIFDESVIDIKPESCFCWFDGFFDCEQIVGIENLDTQNVKDMSCMFSNFASNVQKAPVLDLSKWNTYNVTDMHEMFFQFAYNIQEAPVLNVSKWNTSNVTDMRGMFSYFAFKAQNPLTIDVSNWDTSNVTDMSYMFFQFAYNAQKSPILDVGKWDTGNVKNMSAMFSHFAFKAQNPPILNVSNWDTSNVENMLYMFSAFANKSIKPATIYASDKFVVREDTISVGMFYNSNIQGGAGTTYDSEHINGAGACIDKLGGEWGLSKGYFTGGVAAIEFYANGADGTLPVTVMHDLNSEFVLPNIGEITPPNGFNFSGWAIGSVTGEIKQPNDVIIINKYTPVYAVWKNKVYSISFNENPPSKVDVVNNVAKPFNVTFGNGLNESVLVPECEGYIFEGYYYSYTNADGETSNVQIYDRAGRLVENANIWNFDNLLDKIIFNANWSKKDDDKQDENIYTISFNTDLNPPYGIEVENKPSPIKVTFNSVITETVEAPRCKGYIFEGFYYLEENQSIDDAKQYFNSRGEFVAEVWDIASSVTLVAKWKTNSNTNTVTLCTNGGNFVDDTYNITSYTSDKVTSLPTEEQITKVGHSFMGWYEDSEFNNGPVYDIPLAAVGNKKFWAKWNALTYTVTFGSDFSNEGKSISNMPHPIEVTFETLLTKSVAVPTCDGYEFDGFYYVEDNADCKIETLYYQANGRSVENIIWKIPRNVTLLAHWKKIENELVQQPDVEETSNLNLVNDNINDNKVAANNDELNDSCYEKTDENVLSIASDIALPIAIGFIIFALIALVGFLVYRKNK